MQARSAVGLIASSPVLARERTETLARETGILHNDRTVDEPDLQFGATARALHQRCELDELQRVHRVRLRRSSSAAALPVTALVAHGWFSVSTSRITRELISPCELAHTRVKRFALKPTSPTSWK